MGFKFTLKYTFVCLSGSGAYVYRIFGDDAQYDIIFNIFFNSNLLINLVSKFLRNVFTKYNHTHSVFRVNCGLEVFFHEGTGVASLVNELLRPDRQR